MSESLEKNADTTDNNNNDNTPLKSSLKNGSNRSDNNSTTGTKLPPISRKVSTTSNTVTSQKKRPMTAKGPRNKTVPTGDKFRKTVGKNINASKNNKRKSNGGESIKLVRKEEEKANGNADHTTDNDKPKNEVVVPIINEIKDDEPTDRTSGDEQELDPARRPTTPNIEALVHKAAFLLEYNASLSSRHNSQVWNKVSTTAKSSHQEAAPISMKGSIPILPMWLAVLCCIFNFIIPGLGTAITIDLTTSIFSILSLSSNLFSKIAF